MYLSKSTISKINAVKADLPAEKLFELPEKVLQFGSGVLLRGLPDYFIDKANKQGIFNGRIVIVKSTAAGDAETFTKQDGLYTLCTRDVKNGIEVEENVVNASVSRVLNAKTDWNKVLKCAENPDLEIIISNTTEIGITLMPQDDIRSYPPESFPGKLLAFLFQRYTAFKGAKDKGLIIIPTELIAENGRQLESIIQELAHLNNLEFGFLDWLEHCNYFCSSLVDRIVPGPMPLASHAKVETFLGYRDELMIMSESYRLWAIEGNEVVAEKLSFAAADEGIVIAPDIRKFIERKLRLLNGSHTFSCGLAFLAGFHTVREAMAHEGFSSFISKLVYEEIVPAITSDLISEAEAKEFADTVLERYRNPHIDHQWLRISMQYSSKMQLRCIPVIERYVTRFNKVPPHMALGFAAHILFMNIDKDVTGKFWGKMQERNYLVVDDKAAVYYKKLQHYSGAALVHEILKDKQLWRTDLTCIPGFEEAVLNCYNELLNESAAAVIARHSAIAVAV